MSAALSDGLPVRRAERLAADLGALEALTRPDRPYTRRAFSDEDRSARQWLTGPDDRGRARPRGRRRRQSDRAGRGRPRPGARDRLAPRHGRGGGASTGLRGVLAGLEVARCLSCRRPSPPSPVRGDQLHLRGALRLRPLDHRQPGDERQARRRHRRPRSSDRRGRSLAAALDSVGGRGTELDSARRTPGEILRYLELHIEQAVSLDRAGLPLGVVTTIAAPSRYRVAVRGRQDHAGGTPMSDRRDAVAAAAELVLLVERLAREAGRGMVGTVGVHRSAPQHDQHRAGRGGPPRGFPRDRPGGDRGDAGPVRDGHWRRSPRGAASPSSGPPSCGTRPSRSPRRWSSWPRRRRARWACRTGASRAAPATTQTTWRPSARSASSSSRAVRGRSHCPEVGRGGPPRDGRAGAPGDPPAGMDRELSLTGRGRDVRAAATVDRPPAP